MLDIGKHYHAIEMDRFCTRQPTTTGWKIRVMRSLQRAAPDRNRRHWVRIGWRKNNYPSRPEVTWSPPWPSVIVAKGTPVGEGPRLRLGGVPIIVKAKLQNPAGFDAETQLIIHIVQKLK